jgi:polyferredoxin
MVEKKTTQPIMVWFLPLIIVGGLFYPLLGYVVLLMMIFFLILSYFKGRFWCANLCPRGSFLDLILNKVSLKRKIPKIFLNPVFKWVVFAILIAFFIFQFIIVDKTVYDIGLVFVRMCLVTTLIAIVIGIPTRARSWCAICPMGTLQTKISSLRKEDKDEKAKD